jgi:hypothetical protein
VRPGQRQSAGVTSCRRRSLPRRPPWCCRVDAVQQTLAELTGIPRGEQILMCEGARLDAAKPLAAYGLPGVSGGGRRAGSVSVGLRPLFPPTGAAWPANLRWVLAILPLPRVWPAPHLGRPGLLTACVLTCMPACSCRRSTTKCMTCSFTAGPTCGLMRRCRPPKPCQSAPWTVSASRSCPAGCFPSGSCVALRCFAMWVLLCVAVFALLNVHCVSSPVA